MQVIFKWILVFIFFAGVTCCTKEETPYQLSDEQLAAIMADIHISESATQHLSLSFRDSMVLVYLDQVLEIHEVPKESFEADYDRLKRDPKKLQLVYAKVIERLNQLKIKKKESKNGKKEGDKKRNSLPKKALKEKK